MIFTYSVFTKMLFFMQRSLQSIFITKFCSLIERIETETFLNVLKRLSFFINVPLTRKGSFSNQDFIKCSQAEIT